MLYVKLFLFLLILPLVGFAQSDENLNPAISWEYGRGFVKTFDLREKGSMNEYFLFNTWLPATFTNDEGPIGNDQYFTKFDILNNEVNINIDGKVMVAPMDVVKGFTIQTVDENRTFLALNPENWDKPATYFEVIADGEIQLLVYYTVKNVGNTYNPAVNAGTKEAKLVAKEDYYILKDNKISKVPSKRRAGEQLFSEFSNAEKYFSKNKVKFKSKNDLVELVDFLNKK